jgi:4-hydroxy-tetrahydrodipicolinate reductase
MESAATRLLIHGASGRMGRAVARLAAQDARFVVVALVARSAGSLAPSAVPAFAAQQLADCPPFDVAIDFSLAPAFDALLAECLARGSALVSGTTGLDPGQRSRMDQAAQRIALLWASNFSIGVVVLEDLVRRASIALRHWQVEITESHHVHKLDAPSGTALTLAEAARHAPEPLPPIQSLREGEVIGEHLVRFQGPGEAVELSHSAGDRDIFARGALEAAARLRRRPAGRWSLAQLLLPD